MLRAEWCEVWWYGGWGQACWDAVLKAGWWVTLNLASDKCLSVQLSGLKHAPDLHVSSPSWRASWCKLEYRLAGWGSSSRSDAKWKWCVLEIPDSASHEYLSNSFFQSHELVFSFIWFLSRVRWRKWRIKDKWIILWPQEWDSLSSCTTHCLCEVKWEAQHFSDLSSYFDAWFSNVLNTSHCSPISASWFCTSAELANSYKPILCEMLTIWQKK